jgi:hypothetical protein
MSRSLRKNSFVTARLGILLVRKREPVPLRALGRVRVATPPTPTFFKYPAIFFSIDNATLPRYSRIYCTGALQ